MTRISRWFAVTVRHAEREAQLRERPAARTVPEARLYSLVNVETGFLGVTLNGDRLELSCRRNLCRISGSIGVEVYGFLSMLREGRRLEVLRDEIFTAGVFWSTGVFADGVFLTSNFFGVGLGEDSFLGDGDDFCDLGGRPRSFFVPASGDFPICLLSLRPLLADLDLDGLFTFSAFFFFGSDFGDMMCFFTRAGDFEELLRVRETDLVILVMKCLSCSGGGRPVKLSIVRFEEPTCPSHWNVDGSLIE